MSNDLAFRSPIEISSWNELTARAEFFSKSALIPVALRGKPADVAVVLQMGMELGVPPLQALNGIDVIQGKPCVSPQLGLAMVYSKCPNAYIYFKETSETSVTVVMGRDKKESSTFYSTTWNMERVRKLGLADKDNYKKQPATMLKWRAVGDALRTIFPDVLKGFYLDIELEEKLVGETEQKIEEIEKIINQDTAATVNTDPAQTSSVAEPEVLDESVGDGFDPGDFVIPFGQKHKGKKLSELSESSVRSYVAEVKNSLLKMGKEPDLQHINFYNAAEAYLGGAS